MEEILFCSACSHSSEIAFTFCQCSRPLSSLSPSTLMVKCRKSGARKLSTPAPSERKLSSEKDISRCYSSASIHPKCDIRRVCMCLYVRRSVSHFACLPQNKCLSLSKGEKITFLLSLCDDIIPKIASHFVTIDNQL